MQFCDFFVTWFWPTIVRVIPKDRYFLKGDTTMRTPSTRIPFLLAAVLLTFPLGQVPGWSGTPTANTFTGEVTDTICARSGSQNEMMAKMASMGRDKETCTKKCTQIGAKYVLYDEANKKFYNLDGQAKAEAFAGRKVRVSGKLEGDVIRVANVEAAAG
jgi:hypothetical protein